MKRLGISLLILILLGGAAFFILPAEDTMSTTDTKEYDFAIENTDKIGRIFLADRQGHTTNLVRKADHWEYNGKYRARKNAMDNLLAAIKKMEMDHRPAEAMDTLITKQLSTQGIKVEIFDRDGDRLKSYYVGNPNFDRDGIYMMMEGGEQYYSVTLPGSHTLFDVRFRLTGDEWRARDIFRLDVDDIDTLEVLYPGQTSESFRIFREDDSKFGVEPLDPERPESIHPFKKGTIETYLRGYKRVASEAFRNDLSFIDSLSRQQPFCVVRAVEGEKAQSARFIPTEYSGVKGPNSKGFEEAHLFRYFVIKPGEDVFLAQHRVVRELFWGYSSFFEQPM